MRIVNLMENTSTNSFLCEHGLSIYIETNHHKLLVDTGQSNKTWKNAMNLGIDLSSIDTIFLSHGHYDHAGGILSFIERNPLVTLYMHKNAILDYYSIRNTEYTYIGIDSKIKDYKNIHYIHSDTILDDEISIFTHVTERLLWPYSNKRLKKKIGNEYIQDTFDHEIYIVIHNKGKDYLISGCAHNGILNIIHRYQQIYHKDPDVIISGFHMVRKEYSKKDIEMIKETAYELNKMNTIFYTGHCTGLEPYGIMKEILKEKIQYMHAGDILVEDDYEEDSDI